MLRIIILIPLLAFLFGCSTVIKGAPERPLSHENEMQMTEFAFKQQAVKDYQDAEGVSKVIKRNEIIDARIRAYDIQFGRFEEDLFAFGVGTGIGTDWTTLAISGLTAVTGGETTKPLPTGVGRIMCL